jgi:hypothetical protein
LHFFLQDVTGADLAGAHAEPLAEVTWGTDRITRCELDIRNGTVLNVLSKVGNEIVVRMRMQQDDATTIPALTMGVVAAPSPARAPSLWGLTRSFPPITVATANFLEFPIPAYASQFNLFSPGADGFGGGDDVNFFGGADNGTLLLHHWDYGGVVTPRDQGVAYQLPPFARTLEYVNTTGGDRAILAAFYLVL